MNNCLEASISRCRQVWEKRGRGPLPADQSDGYPEVSYYGRYEDIKSKLHPRSDLTLLDVGCGRGSVLQHLKGDFRDVVAVDIAFSNLCHLREALGPVKTVLASAHQLPFRSSGFDRILLYGVLHYFPSWEYASDVVVELIRVCQSKGIILLGDNEPVINTAFDPPIKKAPVHLSNSRPGDVELCFTKQFFEDVASQLGCEVQVADTWGQPGHFDVILTVNKEENSS